MERLAFDLNQKHTQVDEEIVIQSDSLITQGYSLILTIYFVRDTLHICFQLQISYVLYNIYGRLNQSKFLIEMQRNMRFAKLLKNSDTNSEMSINSSSKNVKPSVLDRATNNNCYIFGVGLLLVGYVMKVEIFLFFFCFLFIKQRNIFFLEKLKCEFYLPRN